MAPGAAQRPQRSPPVAAGLSPLRDLPTAAWGGGVEEPRKMSARPLVYLRGSQDEVSRVCMVFGTPQVMIISRHELNIYYEPAGFWAFCLGYLISFNTIFQDPSSCPQFKIQESG